MNQVNLIGNVSYVNELKYVNTEKGQLAICNFNVAYRDYFMNEPEFIRIETYGKSAENVSKYCPKGTKVSIEGHLKVDTYVDRDGNKKSLLKVVADRVEFLSKPQIATQEQTQTQSFYSTPKEYETPNDNCFKDLGF